MAGQVIPPPYVITAHDKRGLIVVTGASVLAFVWCCSLIRVWLRWQLKEWRSDGEYFPCNITHTHKKKRQNMLSIRVCVSRLVAFRGDFVRYSADWHHSAPCQPRSRGLRGRYTITATRATGKGEFLPHLRPLSWICARMPDPSQRKQQLTIWIGRFRDPDPLRSRNTSLKTIHTAASPADIAWRLSSYRRTGNHRLVVRMGHSFCGTRLGTM